MQFNLTQTTETRLPDSNVKALYFIIIYYVYGSVISSNKYCRPSFLKYAESVNRKFILLFTEIDLIKIRTYKKTATDMK